MIRYSFQWMTALAFMLVTSSAIAQDKAGKPDYVPNSAQGLDDGTQPGWHPLLKASASFALGHNKNVPGNTDGLNLNFGYLINGGLGFLNKTKEHEWINTLLWQLGYTRTPVVDSFIKSVDGIDIKSSYLYHIPSVPWLGPFVSLRLSTAMLPAYDIRPDDTNVLKLDPGEEQLFDDQGGLIDEDGNQIDNTHDSVDSVTAGKKIDLTGAFAPLTLRESAGLFAIPVDKKQLKLDIRLGFGVWETFVRGGYLLEDNDDTDTILELRKMQDSVQMGPELGVSISGVIKQNLTYAVNALLMQPVYHTADTDIEGIDLLNVELEILLGFQLWKWASIDYAFKAYKQPLIVDAWQFQNSLLVSLTFNFIEAETPPPPIEEECECKCPKEVEPVQKTEPAKKREPPKSVPTDTQPAETVPTETQPAETDRVTILVR